MKINNLFIIVGDYNTGLSDAYVSYENKAEVFSLFDHSVEEFLPEVKKLEEDGLPMDSWILSMYDTDYIKEIVENPEVKSIFSDIIIVRLFKDEDYSEDVGMEAIDPDIIAFTMKKSDFFFGFQKIGLIDMTRLAFTALKTSLGKFKESQNYKERQDGD